MGTQNNTTFNTEKYFYLTSSWYRILSHYKAVITKVLLKH